jgi:hypothetical protein
MNVLAFEPDSSQAEAIRHVVCNLVGARLTVATSIEHALHLVRTSTPDLVLLPALVSPSQETALMQALRLLPDASHVDTEITPVLPPRGVDSIAMPQGWRRWTSRRASAAQTTSAEASAFAERLHWALERVRTRKARAVPIDRHEPVAEQPAAKQPVAAQPVDAAIDAAPVAADISAALIEATPEPIGRPLIEPVSLPLDVRPMPGEMAGSLLQLMEGFDKPHVPDFQDLELQDATNRLLKKLNRRSGSDRRQHRRFAASELPGLRSARIKFGPDVALVDVSAGGALLETDARLHPDSEALLELVGSAGEAVVPFRVLRCQIAGLNGSPRYLGACVFTQPLDLDELAWAAAGAEGLEARMPALTLVPARVAARNAW